MFGRNVLSNFDNSSGRSWAAFANIAERQMIYNFISKSVTGAGITLSAVVTAFGSTFTNFTTGILSWFVLIATLLLLLRKVVCYARKDFSLGQRIVRRVLRRRRELMRSEE